MNVSSRTPEGFPSQCRLCGNEVYLEFSNPGEDATCPHCGNLIVESPESMEALRLFAAWPEVLIKFKFFLEQKLGTSWDSIDPSSALQDLNLDSIEVVELVMLLEEEFDVTIPDEDAKQILTLGDLVRYILKRQGIE